MAIRQPTVKTLKEFPKLAKSLGDKALEMDPIIERSTMFLIMKIGITQRPL